MNSHVISCESTFILNGVLTKSFRGLPVNTHGKPKHRKIRSKNFPSRQEYAEVKTGKWDYDTTVQWKIKTAGMFSGSVTKYVLRCPTRPPGDESTRFLSHFGFPVLELRRGRVHGTPPLGTG